MAYVGSGRLDGYFHNNINLWDVAAGILIVKEAGGIVNDIDKFDINNIDIKASSTAINDKMIENLVLACVVDDIPNVVHGIAVNGQFTLQHTDNYTDLDRVWDSAWSNSIIRLAHRFESPYLTCGSVGLSCYRLHTITHWCAVELQNEGYFTSGDSFVWTDTRQLNMYPTLECCIT